MKNGPNRRFRRYTKSLAADVFRGTEARKGSIINYSLEGLGVIMEDPLQVERGDILHIDCDFLSIHSVYEVIWSDVMRSGLKVGLQRREPIKGELKHYKLPDILIGIQRSLRDGVLRFSSGPMEKRIFFKRGQMIFARSNQTRDRLGDLLLREGKITLDAFSRSAELIRKTGEKQGAILVELGAITPKDLLWAVKHQVEEIILGLFAVAGAEFEFIDGALPTDEVITLKLSTGHLIYKGVKRLAGEGAPDIPPGAVIAFYKDTPDLFWDISFDEEDRAIISLIDGETKVEEIVSTSGLDRYSARNSMGRLLQAFVIELTEGPDQETVRSDDSAVPVEVMSDIRERIEQMYSEYPNIDYYSMLLVNEFSSSNELRSAFYRVAMEFHPERYPDLDGAAKEKLQRIFTSIINAYNVLSRPEKRKDCERSMPMTHTVKSRAELAVKKFGKGFDEYERGNYAEAVQFLEEAASLDDSEFRYQYYCGLALAGLDRLKEAERRLSRACLLAPENDEILAELGYICFRLGFPMRAMWKFRKALECNESNQKARDGLEMIKRENGTE